MPDKIILQQSPDATALMKMRQRLAAVRLALSEREAEVAQVRAQLKAFEGRYLHRVGVLYAELDEINARITEREVDLYDSDSARRRALEARRRAQETHDAAFGADESPPEIDPPPNLKTLFRELARRIHPDFAGDEAEQKHFTLLMMRANEAYSRGDAETLQRLLDDHREISAPVGESDALTLQRVTRQIQHAERDIAALHREQETLLCSEIGQLFMDAGTAERQGSNLLDELATSLRERIADAQYRLEFTERQVSALGK